ncbi:hypothetical protein K8R33_02445 [archaeon]|nr:hypothetical protein [archaeon]
MPKRSERIRNLVQTVSKVSDALSTLDRSENMSGLFYFLSNNTYAMRRFISGNLETRNGPILNPNVIQSGLKLEIFGYKIKKGETLQEARLRFIESTIEKNSIGYHTAYSPIQRALDSEPRLTKIIAKDTEIYLNRHHKII